jgi:hypothetical protein
MMARRGPMINDPNLLDNPTLAPEQRLALQGARMRAEVFALVGDDDLAAHRERGRGGLPPRHAPGRGRAREACRRARARARARG